MRKTSWGESQFPGLQSKKQKLLVIWVWEILIGKMHIMKPPARWISQVFCPINIGKNIFQFSLCHGLVSPRTTVPVEICPSCFSSSGYLKRPSTRSLSLTQGLKSFSAISCNLWSFWYQAVSLVRTLMRACSASLLLLAPAGPTAAGPASLRALRNTFPHLSLWFCYWNLQKCPFLTGVFNSSSLDKWSSSQALTLTSPEVSFLIHLHT